MADDRAPGFSPAGGCGHVGRVQQLAPCGNSSFVSLTATGLKAWTAPPQPNPGPRAASSAAEPPPHPAETAALALAPNFISAIAAAPRANLLFGAALDGSLRVWSLDKLAQRSACAWGAGTVLQLLHNPRCGGTLTSTCSTCLHARVLNLTQPRPPQRAWAPTRNPNR